MWTNVPHVLRAVTGVGRRLLSASRRLREYLDEPYEDAAQVMRHSLYYWHSSAGLP